MNIAENILKNSLQNVYFLTGTACGGKTTMAKALCEKYGFVHFNDNWHEDNFKIWESIRSEKYQPLSSRRDQSMDWEAYFGRSVEEFLAQGDMYGEYLEFAIIELIKWSQNSVVVADIGAPIKLMTEIAEYNKVACLLAPGELIIRDYYGREDHREFIECIMSLKEPEKKLETQNELFRIGAKEMFRDVQKYGLFYIMRGEDSTVENTLGMLERHFGLDDNNSY